MGDGGSLQHDRMRRPARGSARREREFQCRLHRRALRTENDRLRQQLATSEAEKKGLEERMEVARARIEQLALKLPETKAITA